MARIQGDLKVRSFRFAQRVLAIVDHLPNNTKGWVICRPLVRAGTGIGSNVREADNARTDVEFAHKCSIARKEAGETNDWLDLCISTGPLRGADASYMLRESDALTRILSAIVLGTQRFLSNPEEQPDE